MSLTIAGTSLRVVTFERLADESGLGWTRRAWVASVYAETPAAGELIRGLASARYGPLRRSLSGELTGAAPRTVDGTLVRGPLEAAVEVTGSRFALERGTWYEMISLGIREI